MLGVTRSLALALTAGLVFTASDREASADPETEPTLPKAGSEIQRHVSGGWDSWLYGPSLKIHTDSNRIRPFFLAGGGLQWDPRRLGLSDSSRRFGERPMAGRFGGGIDLEILPRGVVTLEGSYIQPLVETEPTGTVGLKLKLDF